MFGGDFPVGLCFAVRRIGEEGGNACGQVVVRSLEQQAGGAHWVAIGILLGDDDIQPAVAEPSSPELLEGERGGGEDLFVRRQAGMSS